MSERHAELHGHPHSGNEMPWWWRRCTHAMGHYYDLVDGREYGCWRTLREAEGVVILQQTCLHRVHICVELPGAGSMCKEITSVQYSNMEERQILAQVQSQWRELKQLGGGMTEVLE